MLNHFFIVFVLLLVATLLLGVRIFFFRKKFPNIHIGGNKALRKKGIGCYTSQDHASQKTD